MFIVDIFCATMASVVDLVFPYISKKAMNTMLPKQMYKMFFAVMIIIVLAYLIKAVLYYVIAVVGHKMGVLTEAEMRKDIFNHMQKLSCSFYDQNRTGALLSRITNDLFDVTELAHHGAENLIICSMSIIGSLIIMFTLDWRLALALTLVFPGCIAFTMKQRVKMKDANIEVKKKTGIIASVIESSISGIRTAKAFANEDIEDEKFEEANAVFRNSKVDYYKAMGLFHSGMEFTTGIMQVLVIMLGGYLIMQGEMNYIDLVTFTMYVATFVSPCKRLTQFAEQYMAGTAGFTRFLEIMRTEPEIKDKPDAKELKEVIGDIEYKDVSFHYDGGREILKDINLILEEGKCYAVVGPTGEGKTTLCQLLPRFYDVSKGQILINKKDIREFTQHSLRNNIGLIQQDVFIFAGTIKENILYGKPNATDEEVIAAAKKAEIHDEIMELEDGYDSYVGERGVKLSGGQKQRISIARVFLKNPRILIMDEATSALDTITETEIQKSIDELTKNRTSIIVAHRLSTIRNADKIVVLESGQVLECGNHSELMKKNGKYAALFNAQKLV